MQISSLSLHTLVFSTLGLNVKWGVCMCVWLSCKCVCVCVCMSVFMAAVWARLPGTLEGAHIWPGCCS